MKRQIKIESDGIEQTISIPENAKVTVDENIILFEPKFKNGDILFRQYSSNFKYVFILDHVKDDLIYYECILDLSTKPYPIKIKNDYGIGGIDEKVRLASDSEKQQLFSALEREGKRWNPDTLEIEDIKWTHRTGDMCYQIAAIDEILFSSRITFQKGLEKQLKAGFIFKEPHLADLAIMKIREILLDCKHG